MTEKDMKNLLQKLKSSNSEEVCDALRRIQKTYVKDRIKRKVFLQGSVIKTILSLVEHPKFSNISLSIIADACLEKRILFEVIRNDGIKSLIRIMKSLLNDDIQNRACRALGNIAKSDEGFKAIHILKPISNIVTFLTGTQDINCQQTAVRTLRILGKNSKSRDVIARENGIICIAKLLHSSHKDVLLCCTRALAELTINCNVGCARQLLEMQSLKMLIELNKHSEKNIRTNALTSLKNISSLDETRSDLIKAGALTLFTEIAGKSGSLELRRLAALALCNCLNYMHMWDGYGVSRNSGLKSLIEVLRNKELEDIHLFVLSSILPLCYENAVADILLDLEIIQILCAILKKFISANKLKNHLPLSPTEPLMVIKDVPSPKIKAIDLNTTSPEMQSPVSYSTSFQESPFDSLFDLHNTSYLKSNNNFPVKYIPKFDVSSLITFHSSGASSYCSPSSSGSYSALSPKGFSDYNPGSPIGDPWSPNSNNDDPPLCWSPVLSCSDSSNHESEISEHLNNKEKSNGTCTKTLSMEIRSEDVNDAVHSRNDPISVPVLSNLNNTENKKITCEVDSCDVTKLDFPIVSVAPHAPSQIISLKDNITTEYSDSVKDNISMEYSDSKSEADSFKDNITTEYTDSKSEADSFKDNITTEYTDPKSEADSVKESASIKKHKLENELNEDFYMNSTESSAVKKSKLSIEPSNLELSDSSPSETNCIYDKSSIDHLILSMLMQFSYLDKKGCKEYASSVFLSILLDYITLIKNPNPKAEKFLISIIKNKYTFDILIKSGFLLELETRLAAQHDLNACNRCSHLNSVQNNLLGALRLEAESDYGVGTLCHIMSTSEKSSQIHALYLSTKLVTLKPALFRVIVQAKGLSLLMEFLTDTPDLSLKAITSLCQLFQNLKKLSSEGEGRCCVSKTCISKSPSKCSFKDVPTDVTFVVDGITVSACRETICHNSEYFSALLEGYFSESHKNVVTMCDISAETLTTIFHFLHGCNVLNSCPYIKRIPFSVLLELLHQSEKFLLNDVKTYVIDSLCHNLFHNTVSKIYLAAKQCNAPELLKRALSFVLSTNISKKDTLLSCFQDLLGLENSFSFLTDIQKFMEKVFSEYILKSTED